MIWEKSIMNEIFWYKILVENPIKRFTRILHNRGLNDKECSCFMQRESEHVCWFMIKLSWYESKCYLQEFKLRSSSSWSFGVLKIIEGMDYGRTKHQWGFPRLFQAQIEVKGLKNYRMNKRGCCLRAWKRLAWIIVETKQKKLQ